MRALTPRGFADLGGDLLQIGGRLDAVAPTAFRSSGSGVPCACHAQPSTNSPPPNELGAVRSRQRDEDIVVGVACLSVGWFELHEGAGSQA